MVKFIFKVNKIYVLHMQMHVTVPYGVKMHVCVHVYAEKSLGF